MSDLIYEIGWIFAIYSFAGWIAEVCMAVVKKRKFINRGVVSGPVCPIYGTAAAFFYVFLPGLRPYPVFMFICAAVIATVIEFITGALLERLFHQKWWDYANEKMNLDGYVCLKYSLIWGVCGVVMTLYINPLLKAGIYWMPHWLGEVILWVFVWILAADTLGTYLTILKLQKKSGRLYRFNKKLKDTSRIMENALTSRIERRMTRAFPEIETEKLKLKEVEPLPDVFAYGCSFYKLVALFIIGAFLGDIVETIFCRLTMGYWMSRSSVVYGPFSIVWGLACALLTAMLYPYRERNDRYLFILGTVLGGVYEYVCSVFTEIVFGTVFWDYSDFYFNLGGRVNLLYCFFWGLAAVVWIKGLYPFLSKWIEKMPIKPGKILSWLMIVFMVFNMGMSSLALYRYNQRNTGVVTETNALTDFLDGHFPDQRMKRIYPKAVTVEKPTASQPMAE